MGLADQNSRSCFIDMKIFWCVHHCCSLEHLGYSNFVIFFETVDYSILIHGYFYQHRYTLSVLLHHTEPDFPYISDTGTYSPESCIFGQALNIGALVSKFLFYMILVFHFTYRPAASGAYHASPSQLNFICITSFYRP